MKALFVYLLLILSVKAEYSEDFFLDTDRLSFEQKFSNVRNKIKSKSLSEKDKLKLRTLLYDLRKDKRAEVQFDDQTFGSVGDRAVYLLAKLCKYENVLTEGKNIDLTDPFRPDPYNDYNKDEFLSWYEKEYLPNKNLENQERLEKPLPDSEENQTPKSLDRESKPLPEKASSKPDKPKPFPWWLLGVVGLIVVLGFMLLKGKSKR